MVKKERPKPIKEYFLSTETTKYHTLAPLDQIV